MLPAISASSAFMRVVLPVEVPLATRMFLREATAARSAEIGNETVTGFLWDGTVGDVRGPFREELAHEPWRRLFFLYSA